MKCYQSVQTVGTFFCFVNLVFIFLHEMLSKYTYSGYLFLLCELGFFFFLHEMLSKCTDSGYLFLFCELSFFFYMKCCQSVRTVGTFFCFVNLVSFFYMKCYQSVQTVGTFFCFVNLVSFFFTWNAGKVYRQWVPCGCNSSYSFALIVLNLCRCFLHGRKMCMWFLYNPWIFMFFSIFPIFSY